MSEQDGRPASVQQGPTTQDQAAWEAYWNAVGHPWRTEPEIEAERQQYLAERRSITPNIKQGRYPFTKSKLSRADVEWLLATHETGRGPVDWNDVSQRQREGVDLRGADLQHVDLRGLPLAGMLGGLTGRTWFSASPEQCERAAVRMDDALLLQAKLAGAKLNGASLEQANLFRSNLEQTELWGASLKAASLSETWLGGAVLKRAYLEGVDLGRAHLEGVSTPPADLTWAVFDSATALRGVTLGNAAHGYVQVADVNWGGVNLSGIDWSPIHMLGDEYEARQSKDKKGQQKERKTRFEEYAQAVRANRQLAIALREQGMNELASRFSYQAQLMQRKVFWYQRQFGQYLFSLFLSLLAGYGYKPWRSFVAYLLVITAFATAYFLIGRMVGPVLSPVGSFVFSMTSFHGRGFFPGGIQLDDPLTILAALEAFVGLLIEVTFIATLTQRLFGR